MKNTEVLHIFNSFNTRGYQIEWRNKLHTHSLHLCLNHIIYLWARMQSERFVQIFPNLITLWKFRYCTLSKFVTAVVLPRYNLIRFHTFLLGYLREKNDVNNNNDPNGRSLRHPWPRWRYVKVNWSSNFYRLPFWAG